MNDVIAKYRRLPKRAANDSNQRIKPQWGWFVAHVAILSANIILLAISIKGCQ